MPTIFTEPALLGFENHFADATFTEPNGFLTAGDVDELAIPMADEGVVLDMDSDTSPGDRQIVIDTGLAGSAREIGAILISGARCTGFAPEDLQVQVETDTSTAFASPTDWTGVVDFRIQSPDAGVPYRGLEQPNKGPTPTQLLKIQSFGRYRHLARRPVGSEVAHAAARITLSRVGATSPGDELFISDIWAGWGFLLDFNPGPGKFTSGVRYETGNQRALHRFELEIQFAQERDLWVRIFEDFVIEQGEENRGWISWDEGNPQNFYTKFMMGRFTVDDVSYLGGHLTDEAHPNTLQVAIDEKINLEPNT